MFVQVCVRECGRGSNWSKHTIYACLRSIVSAIRCWLWHSSRVKTSCVKWLCFSCCFAAGITERGGSRWLPTHFAKLCAFHYFLQCLSVNRSWQKLVQLRDLLVRCDNESRFIPAGPSLVCFFLLCGCIWCVKVSSRVCVRVFESATECVQDSVQ